MTTRGPRPRIVPWLLMTGAGLLIAAAYYWLRAHHVGKIGDPTDIGGGGILLLGSVITAVGLLGSVATIARRVVRRRRSGRAEGRA